MEEVGNSSGWQARLARVQTKLMLGKMGRTAAVAPSAGGFLGDQASQAGHKQRRLPWRPRAVGPGAQLRTGESRLRWWDLLKA